MSDRLMREKKGNKENTLFRSTLFILLYEMGEYVRKYWKEEKIKKENEKRKSKKDRDEP